MISTQRSLSGFSICRTSFTSPPPSSPPRGALDAVVLLGEFVLKQNADLGEQIKCLCMSFSKSKQLNEENTIVNISTTRKLLRGFFVQTGVQLNKDHSNRRLEMCWNKKLIESKTKKQSKITIILSCCLSLSYCFVFPYFFIWLFIILWSHQFIHPQSNCSIPRSIIWTHAHCSSFVFLCPSQCNISQQDSAGHLLLLLLCSVVPTALLIMKRKGFYLMVWPSLCRSDPAFRQRKKAEKKPFSKTIPAHLHWSARRASLFEEAFIG